MDFNSAYHQLNEAQKKAVDTIEGPLMVLAGPGTGKTQVVALRVANILRKTQMNPNNILAITFTEAGVVAMKRRLVELIGPVGQRVSVYTFHGFAMEVASTFPYIFTRLDNATLLDEIRRAELIEKILHSHDLELLRPLKNESGYIDEIGKKITKCKQENITPSRLVELITQEAETKSAAVAASKSEGLEAWRGRLLQFAKLYEIYEREIERKRYYDFEDIIFQVTQNYTASDELKAHFQEKYQYVIVDEYQDTNNTQAELVRQLTSYFDSPNLCVVGDDKQSIFRFQGASVSNLLEFKQNYPGCKIVSLQKNYRSQKEIISVADRLIVNNRSQIVNFIEGIDSQLIPVRTGKGEVSVVSADTPEAELALIGERVRSSSGTVAVLTRTNKDVDTVKRYLQKSGIAVAGESSFTILDSSAVNLICSVLRSVAGVGTAQDFASTLLLLSDSASHPELLGQIRNEDVLEKISKSSNADLRNASSAYAELALSARSKSVTEIIEQIISLPTFAKQVIGGNIDTFEAVAGIINKAKSFELESEADVLGFINYIDTARSRGIKLQKVRFVEVGGVVVSTIYKVKGLEFDSVILYNSTESNWKDKSPNDKLRLPESIIAVNPAGNETDLEELRRVFYVGITRAKDSLLITYSALNADNKENVAAKFVSELLLEQQLYSIKNVSQEASIAIAPRSHKSLSVTQSRYIKELLSEYALSYTSLKCFEECPRRFLLSEVLRLPTPPSTPQLFGTLAHKALEVLSRTRVHGADSITDDFIAITVRRCAKNIVPLRYFDKIVGEVTLLLCSYREQFLTRSAPIQAEYSFRSHGVMIDNVRVTGKFDLIEAVSKNSVRVVDFKASKYKSRNSILGKTKAKGMIDQLIFYAMLAKNDPLFPYKVKELSFVFLDKDRDFKEESFAIASEDVLAMEKRVVKAYETITQLSEFKHTNANFSDGYKICAAFPEGLV